MCDIDYRYIKGRKLLNAEFNNIAIDLCNYLDISINIFKTRTRIHKAVLAKKLFCYHFYTNYNEEVTLQQIGDFVNLDHATVLHHYKNVIYCDYFKKKYHKFIMEYPQN